MKATVGRIVHFFPESRVDRAADAQPLAAIVTRCNQDGTVNLHVFHSGEPVSVQGKAAGIAEGDPRSDLRGRLWCWPPRVELTAQDMKQAMLEQARLPPEQAASMGDGDEAAPDGEAPPDAAPAST